MLSLSCVLSVCVDLLNEGKDRIIGWLVCLHRHDSTQLLQTSKDCACHQICAAWQDYSTLHKERLDKPSSSKRKSKNFLISMVDELLQKGSLKLERR